jgi:hypothetical protein
MECSSDAERKRWADTGWLLVLFFPVGKEPYLRWCYNYYKDMQKLVGGDIECFPLDSLYGSQFESGALAVVNEEGKITQGIRPNRKVFHKDELFDVFYGDFFICGQDGEGNMTSITNEQEDYYRKTFPLSETGV